MKKIFFFIACIIQMLFGYWGEQASGVAYKFTTSSHEIALTFDACSSNKSTNQFDAKLINFLESNNIQATFFVTSQWIENNKEAFLRLAKNPLFAIENHGKNHMPLSINGKKAYGIQGTKNKEEIIEEITYNQQKIFSLTGKIPTFFRSGTAFYDNDSVQIAKKLGVIIAGFSIIGDDGATLSKEDIFLRLRNVKPGDIVIAHANHPESETFAGFEKSLLYLQSKKVRFVLLRDIKNRLVCY